MVAWWCMQLFDGMKTITKDEFGEHELHYILLILDLVSLGANVRCFMIPMF